MPRTPPLANDLWMAAHDTPRGDSQLQPRPLGIALTGGLLAELTLGNWIWVQDELIYLNPDGYRYNVEDAALAPLMERLREDARDKNARRHQHAQESTALELEYWVQRLQADLAQELVEIRLRDESLIQPEERGVLRKKTVWVPSSANVAGWPASRLRTSLREGAPLTEQDLALAGLVMAVGLSKSVLADLGPRHLEFLAQQTQSKMRPALLSIMVTAEHQIGKWALTGRR